MAWLKKILGLDSVERAIQAQTPESASEMERPFKAVLSVFIMNDNEISVFCDWGGPTQETDEN